MTTFATNTAPPISGRATAMIRRFWVPIVLVLVAVGYAGYVTVQHSDAMSPVDEWVYTDYLDKLPAQGWLQQGEAIGDDALGRMACDGVFPYGPMGPQCGANYDDESKFPFGGITSADPYTPIYFAITRFVGDAIHFVTGADQLTGWRLTGALWLAASMVMFWVLLRQWRVPPVAVLGLGLAVIASPFAWWTYTYVSTDAPSFLLGAALLFLAARIAHGQSRPWWLIGLAVLAVLFKVTNILGVGLAVLYLLVAWLCELWIDRRRRSRVGIPEALATSEFSKPGSRVWLIAGIGTAVAAIATQFAWLRLHAAFASGDGAQQGISVPLDVQELVAQITNFLPGTITANVNIAGSTGFALPIPGFAVAPLSWVTIAGVIAAFWTLRGVTARTPLVVAVAIAAAFFAPALAVALYVMTGSYFPLPPRYGAPILAGMLLATGTVLNNRWAHWILVGYAGALLVAMTILTAALPD